MTKVKTWHQYMNTDYDVITLNQLQIFFIVYNFIFGLNNDVSIENMAKSSNICSKIF